MSHFWKCAGQETGDIDPVQRPISGLSLTAIPISIKGVTQEMVTVLANICQWGYADNVRNVSPGIPLSIPNLKIILG